MLGWLRDIALVFLLVAGNHIRHDSPAVGIAIMVCAGVVFVERFFWSWLLSDLRDLSNKSDPDFPPNSQN